MISQPEPHKVKSSLFRRFVATTGVVALIGLGLAGHSRMRVPLTALAVVALLCAAFLVVLETHRARRNCKGHLETKLSGEVGSRAHPASWPTLGPEPAKNKRRWPGWPFALAIACVTIGASQTWFISGTALAGGDMTPPVGTAWIGRLFEPWVWSGGNLGSPNTLPIDLPWAFVDFVVHELGGSGALAQRIWLSGLFVGAALAGYWLLRILGLAPIAAAAGALVWVFNPYVVADVGVNDVYLAAMVLVALWPAVVFEVARGRWRLRWALVAFLASTPLAGFVYSNPPLLGLAAGAAIIAALIAGWLDGRSAARRALSAVTGGLFVVAGASAYWLVPSLLALQGVSAGLASTSSWGWTEGRVAVANGFWLNTVWGWSHRSYYPYAYLYNQLPLSLVKYLLPTIAFSSLALSGPLNSSHQRRRARLAAFSALASLFLIIFGTGTVAPGSLVFDPIYHLPLGWLLQDPGRFLMAAALGYAIMIGVTVEIAVELSSTWVKRRVEQRSTQMPLFQLKGRTWAAAFSTTTAIAMVALVGAFPVAAGSLVPRFGKSIPESHVRIPRYWTRLAAQMNHQSPHATVVILPPDDFYQMPYTWYYGADGFITNLLSAHVLDPTSAGYTPSSKELLSAVDQLAGSLLEHRWQAATDIMGALGATEMLVRGDINAHYPGTKIVPPAALMNALSLDPQAQLLDQVGPLRLYGITRADDRRPVRSIVTVNTNAPDLAVLQDLAPGAALVSGPPEPGHPSVLQTPPLSSWKIEGRYLRIAEKEPAGWRYRVATLPSLAPLHNSGPAAPYVRASVVSSRALPDGSTNVTLQVPLGTRLLEDGGFSEGLWGPVGNCNAVPGTTASADLHAEIVAGAGPRGFPALQLSARADRACEAQTLHWSTGQLLVSLWYRSLRGEGASICLWEVGPNSCASGVPTLATTPGWHHLQFVSYPSKQTKKLILFLYATPQPFGSLAVDQYADLSSYLMLQDGQPILIGCPITTPPMPSGLVVSNEGFSSNWSLPIGGHHVIVDGLRNGWVLADEPLSRASSHPTYLPSTHIAEANILSAVMAALVVLDALLSSLASSLANRRRGRWPHVAASR